MLLGDFCAIASSVVFAMYALSSTPILKSGKATLSIYLALMCVYIILMSCALSWFMGNPVDLFSTDAVTGVFGMFSTW